MFSGLHDVVFVTYYYLGVNLHMFSVSLLFFIAEIYFLLKLFYNFLVFARIGVLTDATISWLQFWSMINAWRKKV